MIQSIAIREFRKEDLEAVHRLIHQVVDVSYRVVYPEGALKIYREYHNIENIRQDTEAGYCVVAENGNGIVGTGMLLEENIRRVYIDPDCQHRGIGNRIYAALESKALEKGKKQLDLSASLVARDFWEKHGFTVESVDSIPFGEDKLMFFTMIKNLTETKRQ